MDLVPERLLDARSDPDHRAALEDWLLERGWRLYRYGLLASADGVDDAVADSVANAVANAADAAAADTAAAVTAAADAAAAADAVDVADAAVVAADAAAPAADAVDVADAAAPAADAVDAADAALVAADAAGGGGYYEEVDMSPGLRLVQLPGRYNYSVTRVGWLRRVQGDEYLLVGAVTVSRLSGRRNIASLAHEGPGADHTCSEPDPEESPEELHRLGPIRRCRPATESAWASVCPRPRGWAP